MPLRQNPLWIQIDQAWTCAGCGTTFEKPNNGYVTGLWTVERTSAIYDLRIKDAHCKQCVFGSIADVQGERCSKD